MKKKLYCVGWGCSYANWINDIDMTGDYEDPRFEIEDADIVLFTGGEDVSPYLYGKEPHPTSYWTESRDAEEVAAFKRMHKGQLAYGTCRGLQLLNVMNGGILCQDVSNHWCSGTHEIHNEKGEKYRITSLHHQMVYPYDLNPDYYEILYTSTPRSDHYDGDGINPEMYRLYGEPEVVLYKNPDLPVCLGVQGHPEMMSKTSPVDRMLNMLIDDILYDIRK